MLADARYLQGIVLTTHITVPYKAFGTVRNSWYHTQLSIPYKTGDGARVYLAVHLKDLPSCLRRLWKTTVRAGALTPMAKVSVEKSTFMRPRQNSISTTSFMIGSSPVLQQRTISLPASQSVVLAFDQCLVCLRSWLFW